MSNDVLAYLANKMQEEMHRIEQEVVLGGYKDSAEYKYACGMYRGLLIAKNAITDTKERMEQDDE
jgi:hypothetical protein